ncbi:MAG: MBL fold metallo-hydrolase [Lachnospiraceae bacterium]|nr:MBL fold metallo-hydrolase [Lachnospiraceae bacterium]
MQITALVDNISYEQDLGAEHGLSLYIETGAHKILFDMGQTELFAENAEKLGIDLADVDMAVLSHGHYDHGGGLRRFLQINQKAPVYLSRYAFNLLYHGPVKYIGLDQSIREEVTRTGRLRYTPEQMGIGERLTLYSCNDRKRISPLDSAGLEVEIRGERSSDDLCKGERVPDDLCMGERVPDDFCHEQYLLVEEEGRRILFSGCSHKGIFNIVEWLRPDVLIGGFHFSKLPLDDTLAGYAQRLDRTGTVFYTGHCTGKAQFDFMKGYMGKLHYLSVGQRIQV